MRQINIHDAKTQLSRLVEDVAGGEEIVIAKAGKPMARLTAFEPANAPCCLGMLKGKISIADDFDAPLPEEILAAFEGVF